MPAPKPLSREDIEISHKNTRSNRAAARFLGVSYWHYKKFAKLYKDKESGKSLFETHLNPSGKGIPKFAVKNNGKKAYDALQEIMQGGTIIDHFTPKEIKEALIKEGFLKSECYHCGFNEERVLDRRVPILLNFKDKNKRNFRVENLEMLCYNCYYLYIGDVFNEKQIIQIEDYFHSHSKEAQIDWEIDMEYIELLKKQSPNLNDDEDGSEFISRI